MIGLAVSSIFLSVFSVLNILGLNRRLVFNQIAFACIGIGVYIGVKKLGRHFFKNNAHLFYWLFALSLIVTYVVGIEVKGSRRWIDLFFFNFQASEFFKVFFILFLAEFLAKEHKNIKPFVLFMLSLLYFIIPTLIIFKQPDLGNAIVFLFIYLMMILFSKLPKRYFFYSISLILAFIPLGWIFFKQYQRDRILSFFMPHLDQQGTSYNMIQSIITVGSGRFFGHGLGLGTQSHLRFLPENHTDFAFSSLVEQFGFVGGVIVLMLFGVLIASLARRALHYFYQSDEDGQSNFLFIIGLMSYLIFQITVNVGMNLGIFPVAGIALPFISYGGSSLVAILIGLALLP